MFKFPVARDTLYYRPALSGRGNADLFLRRQRFDFQNEIFDADHPDPGPLHDRQLGGRAGRQGDPGSFEFFACLEDELLIRWSKMIAAWALRRARRRKGRRLSRIWILLFELAQRTIERRHLRIRLDLLEHDKKLEEMKGTLGVPVWG